MSRTLNATEFKAKCLGVLDEVARTGRSVIIVKRGRPVAELVPPARSPRRARIPQEGLKGSGEILGDIVTPPLPPQVWEAARGRP